MSTVVIQGTPGGGGAITIAAPATNTTATLQLPDATTSIAGTDAGQTLTNKTLGTGLAMATSQLTSEGVVTFSGATTMVLATDLPSWIKNFCILFNAVSVNGTSNVNIQFGTGSGVTPTWITTGYVSATDNYSTAVGTVASSTTGFRIGRATTAATTITAIYTIARMGGTSRWVGQLNGILDTGTSLVYGGGYVVQDPVTAIRLTTAGGANLFDGGSAVVWYE